MQAQLLQASALGRHGDTFLGHLSPGETIVPMPVLEANPALKRKLYSSMQEMGLPPARYTVGSMANSINPMTGQPEFFDLFNIGDWADLILKPLGKAAKGIMNVAQKVAPILLPIVAPFLLPGLPLAFSAGLGSFAGGLIAGQKPKDALKNALISGAFAGIGNKLAGGSFFGSRASPNAGLSSFSFRQPFTPTNPVLNNPAAGSPYPVGNTPSPSYASAGGSPYPVGNTPAPTTSVPVAPKPNFFRRNIYNPDPNTVTIDPQTGELVTQGEGRLESLLSPNRTRISPEYRIQQATRNLDRIRANNPTMSPEAMANIENSWYEAAAKPPTAFQKYAPLAATSLGVASLLDAKQGPEQVDIASVFGPSGRELYAEDVRSGKYRYAIDPSSFDYARPSYEYDYDFPYYAPRYAKHGGEIRGPGTDVSDSIPAMLSDGEFVMTAAAVRGAGGGDRAKGALRMYELMREFEEASQDGS